MFSLLFILLLFECNTHVFTQSCNHGRIVVTNSTYGIISDGFYNYRSNQRCEWLIISPDPQNLPIITLEFKTKKIECIFDNVVVYDGNSTQDKVLAVLSGDETATNSLRRVFAYSGYMLVSLFSDSNYELEGFKATFQITSCRNNCSGNGICSYNRCLCVGVWYGSDCSSKSCENNLSDSCNKGLCNTNTKTCMCNREYIGSNCQTSTDNNENTNAWAFIANSDTQPQINTALSGHAAVYLDSVLWVFGGYDLNQLYNALIKYDLRRNSWNRVYSLMGVEPSARMQHTMNHIRDGNKDFFLVFGGDVGNSTFSSELWSYSVTNNTWSRLSNSAQPLAQHASAVVRIEGEQFLYVFGGRITGDNGFLFSSEMKRFGWRSKEWEVLAPDPGGINPSVMKLAGHSMVYDEVSKSLVIFGGFTVPESNSLRSDRVVLYDVGRNHWQELNLLNRPHPRGFHSANIIGDYMLIYGGNVHMHKEVETCYSDQLYLYHLRCHSWTSVSLPSDTPSGRFGHSAVAVGQNSVIIYGGFNGQILSDVVSYKVPMFAISNTQPHLCSSYLRKRDCLLDQMCAWCDRSYCVQADKCNADENYSVELPVCKGICRALKSCVSCSVFNTHIYSSYKLNRSSGVWDKEDCGWCVEDSKCHSLLSIPSSSLCGPGIPPSGTAWWGIGESTLVSGVGGCVGDNLPPGLLAAQYHNDPHFTSPDQIYFLKKFSMLKIDLATGLFVVQVKGFLHTANNVNSKLILSTQQGEGKLVLEDNSSVSQITTTQSESYQTNSTLVNASKYSFNFTFTHIGEMRNKAGSFILQWEKNNKVVSSEYLQPFTSQPTSCQSYRGCKKCVTDYSCAWCSALKSCESRVDILSGKVDCGSNANSEFFGVVLEATSCTICMDSFSCVSCLSHSAGDCVWDNTGYCVTNKGYDVTDSSFLFSASSCPAPCHTLTSCGDCFSTRNTTGVSRGSCVWCATTRRCYSYTHHLSSSVFGECPNWLEEVDQCVDCSLLKNCRDCLNYYHCGWLSSNEVLDGVCTNGDFGAPYNKDNSKQQWFYENCPAVNECVKEWPIGSKLHTCHLNATCTDIEPGFSCECNAGFSGDGIICNRTCLKKCGNGKCSGFPDYECICDLGWTSNAASNEFCDVDCLCNYHSTCDSGVGLCDKCQHDTTGHHCDTCRPGYHGDARHGCQACSCHGHGDVARGTCHETTGECRCLNNTRGSSCEECEDGYYGNPRDNGVCFRNCNGRSLIISSMSGSFGLNTTSRRNGAYCAWFIKTPEDHLTIKLTILNDFYIPCMNKLQIFDGMYSFDNSTSSKVISSMCGGPTNKQTHLYAYSGYMTVLYDTDSVDVGHFSAMYEICDSGCGENVCPLNCSNHGTCVKGVCDCDSGYIGIGCKITINHLNLPYFWQPFINHGNSPLPTFGQTMVSTGDGLLIFGGMAANGPTSDLHNCTIVERICSKITSRLPPSGRYFHSAVSDVRANKMFVFGGVVGRGLVSNQLWSFDFERGWEQLPHSSIVPGLAGHTMTLFNDSFIIVIGGLTDKHNFNHKVFSYDITNQQWGELGVKGSRFRGDFGHTATHDPATRLIYVYGGLRGSTEGPGGQIFVLDPLKQRWTRISDPKGDSPNGRYFHSAAYYRKDNEKGFIVFGGRNGKEKFTNDIFLFRFQCNTWTKLNFSATDIDKELYDPELGIGGSSVNIDNKIYYFGGSYNGILSGEIKVLNIKSICFTATSKQACEQLMSGCIICQSSNGNSGEEILCLPSKENNINDSLLCDIKLNNPNPHSQTTGTCSAQPVVPCDMFKDCKSCVGYSPPNQDGFCEWCLSGSSTEYGCFPTDHPCNQSISLINEGCDVCWPTNCDHCISQPNCSWQGHDPLNPNQGCGVKKSPSPPLNPIPISDKKKICPTRCDLFTTCSTCVTSDLCRWSPTLDLCVDPTTSGLFCIGGSCEKSCDDFECGSINYCLDCIQQSGCGWGLGGGLGGVCMKGGFQGPSSTNLATQKMSWHYISCPAENECETGHHTCVTTPPHHEICTDNDVGYNCDCKSGYRRGEEFCEPFCNPGCVNGECVSPNKCRCKFGFVGQQCNHQCKCNGNSDCTEKNLANCTQCINNTEGPSCESCKVGFVGDPTKQQSCVPCEKICNGRSQHCVARQQTSANQKASIFTRQHDPAWSCEAGAEVVTGPRSRGGVCCVNCSGNSQGFFCDECMDGYFMLNGACRKCDCNGHGTFCNRDNGAMCHCGNHTASSAQSRCHNSPAMLDCWRKQCDECETNYAGSPATGGQCYKEIGTSEILCFDASSCAAPNLEGIPLLGVGRTSFFALKPQFTNVDIRLIVDVTEGEVDVFVSAHDDTFIIRVDPDTGVHSVVVATRNITHTQTSKLGSSNDLVVTHVVVTQTQRKLRRVEFEHFNTYTEMKPHESLHVAGVRDRLIVTCSHHGYNLSLSKFFVVLLARELPPAATAGRKKRALGGGQARGRLLFRQDQTQIDLFVFFSVFFSCFFLFLSLCILVWKVKQTVDRRQAHHAHHLQLQHMASRPFSCVCVYFDPAKQPSSNKQRKSLPQNSRGDCSVVRNSKGYHKVATEEGNPSMPLSRRVFHTPNKPCASESSVPLDYTPFVTSSALRRDSDDVTKRGPATENYATADDGRRYSGNLDDQPDDKQRPLVAEHRVPLLNAPSRFLSVARGVDPSRLTPETNQSEDTSLAKSKSSTPRRGRKKLRRCPFKFGPITFEPLRDVSAGVATVVLALPGGDSRTPTSVCLGSCLLNARSLNLSHPTLDRDAPKPKYKIPFAKRF